MTKEITIQNAIRAAIQEQCPEARIFRNNTAQGWGGRTVARTEGTITLANPTVIHAGLIQGSSDLIGWRTIRITPDMVGMDVAAFVAIEVKTESGKATPEQETFIRNVRRAGGLAGIARNADQALAILAQTLIENHCK